MSFLQNLVRPIIYLLGLLLILLVGYYIIWPIISHETDHGETSAQPPDKNALPIVTVAKIVNEEISSSIPISGSMQASNEVLVGAEVSGFSVSEILFDVGDKVVSGDVLAVLDSKTLRAQYAQAESQYASAQTSLNQANSDLARMQKLVNAGVRTSSDLEQASSAAANASAAFQQARAAREVSKFSLENANMISPVRGVISARNLEIGAVVAAGGPAAFTIIESSKIEFKADVTESALKQVRVGTPVLVSVDGVGDIVGNVRMISPSVNGTTRLGTLNVEFNDTSKLNSGVYASGEIKLESRQSLTAPATSIVISGTDKFVQVVGTDGVIKSMNVETGVLVGNRREILSGVEEGQDVLLRAGAFYRDGDKVEPIQEGQSSPADTAEEAEQ